MLKEPIIILSNGVFPTHSIPLIELDRAKTIICCDGAADQLVKHGKIPDFVIGDLDSISLKTKLELSNHLIHFPNQDENDLRKAINWVNNQGSKKVSILGATGKREDHLLGNIFSILQYKTNMDMEIITDYGKFYIVDKQRNFKCIQKQEVSLFCLDPSIKISTTGLKYELQNVQIPTLYSGTLNEVIQENFNIQLSHGKILVYCAF